MPVRGLIEQDAVTSRWSAWALGEIGSEQAIRPLITCLEQREDCEYAIVGDALRKLGSPRAADAYIAGLRSGTWWVQTSCAAALGDMKSEKGLPELIKMMRHGEVRVRRAAVLALSEYPARQAEAALKEALTRIGGCNRPTCGSAVC